MGSFTCLTLGSLSISFGKYCTSHCTLTVHLIRTDHHANNEQTDPAEEDGEEKTNTVQQRNVIT